MSTDERDTTPATRPATTAGRFRPHTLTLPDGGRLVIRVDGQIERLDADGTTAETWRPDDPDWPRWALRFGLRPQPTTVAPRRDVRPRRP
jgi:hypothetical protein